MLEIEMKFSVADFSAIEGKLRAWKATRRPAIDESDQYFNAPDRDFRQTDEAFRLRRVGTDNRITYKGPKQPGPAKTREEIELGLEPGADTAEKFFRLVQHLGYRPTAVVHKQRTIYDFQRDGFAFQACCDEVKQVGRYVEIEVVADPAQRDRAQEVLLQVVQELGLKNSERRSYLEMLLAKQAS